MTGSSERFHADVAQALEGYLAGEEEAALHAAYELGRRALDQRLGVIDVVAALHAALVSTLGARTDAADPARIAAAAESVILECLSPFEMAHRAALEAVAVLRRQHDLLEGEIRKIAHEIHDEAGQFLTLAHLAVARAAASLGAPAGPALDEVRLQLDQVEGRLRRLSHELYPTVLDDLGLEPALRFLGEGISERTGLAVTVEGPARVRLPSRIETAIYRVAQEALTNVARHAKASRAHVAITRDVAAVRCSIRDDGVGFDAAAAPASSRPGTLGLLGMRERVRSLGGTLHIESHCGHGTEVVAILPVKDGRVAPHPAG